ncbi:MAG TPA: PASTA domain-containing protein [Solirubrobacteraceae bacterium]|nr:PASTA domain-containing protein [Solirubrobacteraceae bacterium]
MREISADTVIDGRYQVIDKLGAGGMADVWVAEDLQLGRKVAVKVLHRRFTADQEFVERFRREAQSAAGLQHQHVVAVYDRGEWDDTYYIAMEYLQGRSLKEVVRDEGPLDPLRAVDIIIQILRAARFAHRRGIIHRDLKPHNVILDDEDRAKVTDFGIAKAGASDMTQTGSIMGTAQYLSPEQAQGYSVTAQSDLYAIGIVLYEMLTARVPFEAESAVTIALKQVNEVPVPPSELNAAVPPELEGVVLRALEKDPARRFQDADEFIATLETVRSLMDGSAPVGTGTTAFVPPPVLPAEEGEVAAAPRRRRWPWAVVAGLLVAGVVLGVLLLTGPARVVVPDVVGADVGPASQALRGVGFDVDVTRRQSFEPSGEVVGQDPGPRTRAEEGSTVTLTVSQGPGEASVPDVAGQSADEARERLQDAGFRVREEDAPSASVQDGDVIETRPDAGTQINRGSPVTMVVSSGPELAAVPSVVGDLRAQATSELQAAGFQVGVQEAPSDSEPGTVIDQTPGGGERAATGSTVTITVAGEPEAPEEVSVPGVTGLTREAAVQRLSARGFRVSIEETDVERASQAGRVQSQSPSGGTAPSGSTVTITVGRLNNSEPEPEADGGGDGGGGGSDDPGEGGDSGGRGDPDDGGGSGGGGPGGEGTGGAAP